jgi:4-hydroxybenzoate polyprenyltransferase
MHFLKLIRTGNLIFLIILFGVFRYSVLIPFLYNGSDGNPNALIYFMLLVAATVLIAAGGYVINDYYDSGIDKINKPEKRIVGSKISRPRVLLIHMILTTAGVVAGISLSVYLRSYGLMFAFLMIPAALWYYSAKLKKQLLYGNILIAILSFLPLILLTYTEIRTALLLPAFITPEESSIEKAWQWTFTYAVFSFLIMFAREIVKDMEDIQGDSAYNRRTLATEHGNKKAGILAIIVIFLLILTILLVLCINYHIFMPVFIVYIFLTLITPLIISIILLIKAKNKNDFHKISGILKAVMLAGILTPAILSLQP